MTDEQKEFYDICLEFLRSRHGDAQHFKPELRRYVQVTFKASALLDEIMDEEVTIEQVNQSKQQYQASSPKVRMFAVFNEQAMKLGKGLGLMLYQGKAGRPAFNKKRFDFNTSKNEF